MVRGAKYVDSTVFRDGENLGILSYKSIGTGWQLVCFSLDMENKTLNEESVIEYQENIGSPGGYLLKGNKRLAEDWRRKYG